MFSRLPITRLCRLWDEGVNKKRMSEKGADMVSMNRRNFLKGMLTTGMLAGAGAAASGLVGCAPTAQPSAGESLTGTRKASDLVAQETIETQVVICGGGLSGLTAAVQAAQNGLATTLLEIGSALGGNGTGVEGIFVVGSQGQADQGIEIDAGEVMLHEMKSGLMTPDGALWDDLITSSLPNYEWLLENGVKFNGQIDEYGNGVFKTMHWFEGGHADTGFIPGMQAAAEAAGVDIRFQTEALELSFAEDGSVAGVYAQTGDTVTLFRANAVVLATGGYGQGEKWLQRAGFNTEHITSFGSPANNGRGLDMAVSAGGRTCESDTCGLYSYSIDPEVLGPFDQDMNYIALGGYNLLVNEDGLRCVNEDLAMKNYHTCGAPVRATRNVWCLTTDAAVDAAVSADEIHLGLFEPISDLGAAIAQAHDKMDRALANCVSDNAFKGATVEEVAALAGLNVENVKRTVERYNALCAAGKDTQFSKDAKYLMAFEEGPFYLFRCDPVCAVMIGGIDTNRHMQVVSQEGEPIEGLYAVGVDGVKLYRKVYPIDVPATCCANNVHSGRVAANHIASVLA